MKKVNKIKGEVKDWDLTLHEVDDWDLTLRDVEDPEEPFVGFSRDFYDAAKGKAPIELSIAESQDDYERSMINYRIRDAIFQQTNKKN